VNLISQSVPQQFRRRRFVAFCYFLFAVAAAYLVASYIIADDLKGLALVGMVSAGGAVVIAILNLFREGCNRRGRLSGLLHCAEAKTEYEHRAISAAVSHRDTRHHLVRGYPGV
jgi:hypothetical protein